jgi:hypothetical protein
MLLFTNLRSSDESALLNAADAGKNPTSLSGVGDQAVTYSYSGIQVILATKGTRYVDINIYGTVPLAALESFTNQIL